ncbi:HNH endonuclease family protein [Curtobacterium sp. 22159]|uniref:HNH endonuclease family protein n=1 Tax=Curtobacterium sp. 22159 TaxID=3453882 RepID=UPI003F849814
MPDRQAIADRWERLVNRVQDGRVSSDVPDRFIWQSWNSRRKAVKEPELFKAVGRLVGSDPAAHISYLEELEVDAANYEHLQYEDILVQPRVSGKRNAFAVPEFVDSIRALAIFDVSVANSTVLAIARKYSETNLVKIGQLIEVMRLVENFHFQFNALTSSGSTGGTRSRYNRFALQLEEANSRQEVTDAIADLKHKLQTSLPGRNRTVEAFKALFYAPKLALTQAQKLKARKVYISYVLMAFAKYHGVLPAGQNLQLWTIEHLKPQSEGRDIVTDSIYSIGNLTLLTEALNSSLGSSDLHVKLSALDARSVYLDDDLRNWRESGLQDLSEDQIRQRAERLANDAMEKVWSL